MTELAGLIARLEGGETGREIEVAIFHALQSGEEHADKLALLPADDQWHWLSRFRSEWINLTTSLDAAVALVERVRPGWTIARIGQDDYKRWFCELREGHQTSYDRVVIVMKFATPAASLVAALLRAREPEGQ